MNLAFTRIANAALLLTAFSASHAAEPAREEPSVKNGAATFQRYCVLCHGERGDGNGPAAKVYNPRPADLTASTRSDEYKTTIIRDGGDARASVRQYMLGRYGRCWRNCTTCLRLR